MQRVSEVMTRNVRAVSPDESLQHAAQMMNDLDVGVLPVCDGDRLIGMITDRDITVRAVARGKSPTDAHVDDVMSKDVRWVFEDQSLDDVMAQMGDQQIRRVPVVSHDDHRLVGIVSLGDLALRSADGRKQNVEEVVEMVSSSGASAASIRGRSGTGGAGAAATGTGSAGIAGTELPRAGQHEMGAAGAAGNPDTTHAPGGAGTPGQTADTRRNYGVSGQDLAGDGLPPA